MYQRQSPKELIPTAKWQVQILLYALISKGVEVSSQVVEDAVAQLHGHVNWLAWVGESQQKHLTQRNLSYLLDRDASVIHTLTQEDFKKHNKNGRRIPDDDTDAFDPH